MKTRRMLRVFAFLAIFIASSIVTAVNFEASGDYSSQGTVGPVVTFSPTYVQAEVGQNFTIDVRVENLTNGYVQDPWNLIAQIPLGPLYGIDLQLGWDPTIIHCVSYTKEIPVESYPDGVMHSPTVPIYDDLDETASMPGSAPGATYWLAEASMLPADPFNGSGIFVTMTFNVLKAGRSPLKILDVTMADPQGNRIGQSASFMNWLRPPVDGMFSTPGAPIADFTYSPDMGVANKTMTFNATSSQSNNTIDLYMWSFGDGTKRNETSSITEYTYSIGESGGYTVELRVMDNFGVVSGAVTQVVNVADTRDLGVKSITSQTSIRPNKNLTLTTTVENLGTGSIDVFENATVHFYYNTTAFDVSNTSTGTWVLIGANHTVFKQDIEKSMTMKMNSSQFPVLEAQYYILVNVTGIPSGYENDTTNNAKLSNPILYTLALIHQPTIFDFNLGYVFQRAYKVPVLENETTTLSIEIRNDGNGVDTVNVTFYANGTVVGYTVIPNVPEGERSLGNWSGVISPGYYNITAVALAGNISSSARTELRVVRPPELKVEYAPSNPAVNQEVTFDASGSRHLDPSEHLVTMTWTVYMPGEIGATTRAYTLRGSAENASVNVLEYAFNVSGKWTIVLDVIDSEEFTFNDRRDGTNPYRLLLEVEVVGGGFPMEIAIAAVALVAVLVAVIAFILIRRRRSLAVPTATE